MTQTGSIFSPIYEQEKASRGSTDMGNVSHIVNSIHPVFNIGCEASYHTQEFAIASSGKEAHQRSMNAARALSLTAIDSIIDQ
jgi:metal-dependent amidase/aminoacylase/carboxypeptidase family protein